MKLEFTLNGDAVCLDIDPGLRLIDLLRDRMDLTGTKEGCGEGECGACTVLLDGQAVDSCLVMAMQVRGRSVMTVEGLARRGELDGLQQAFISAGAIQCGFCTPGMLMSAKGLLMQNLDPSEDEIRSALAGNLCRCTGYLKIVQAVQAAAREEAARA
ncbi:MAG TPA: (2Fe-2S)-binding protein [Holophaga sp.]|nr:(2Fe-2S)-binding protein [Holophaga sp.]